MSDNHTDPSNLIIEQNSNEAAKDRADKKKGWVRLAEERLFGTGSEFLVWGDK